jgi:hydrogenase maturation factor
VPIEATAILAREFPEQAREALSPAELAQAHGFLHDPGISVLREARLAIEAGQVTAMHDPTDGGLAAALWELAEASQCSLVVDPSMVPIPRISARLCQAFAIDPLAAIASGALLLTAPPGDARSIRQALVADGIPCAEIGRVDVGPVSVQRVARKNLEPFPRPGRDEITRIFER